MCDQLALGDLQREVEQLRAELLEVRAWCTSLEQALTRVIAANRVVGAAVWLAQEADP